MKKQKENSHEGIKWSEMGKQNVQAKKSISHGIFLANVCRLRLSKVIYSGVVLGRFAGSL